MYILNHIGDDADEQFTVTLDGEEYQIEMKWNSYDEAWRISIGYSGQDPARVKKATVGIGIFISDHHLDGVPEGEIILADTQKLLGRADRDNTGADKRYKLLYLSQDEYTEIFD